MSRETLETKDELRADLDAALNALRRVKKALGFHANQWGNWDDMPGR